MSLVKQKNSLNSCSDSFYMPKFSNLALNAIFSISLFSGFLYIIFDLNKYIQAKEKMNLFNFLNTSIYNLITKDTAGEVLPLLIKKFSLEKFAEVTSVLILLSAIFFLLILFVTFIYNLVFIIYYRLFNNCNVYCLDDNDNLFCPHKKSLTNSLKIINVIYAGMTYLSIIIIEISVAFETIISGSFLSRGFFDGKNDLNTAIKASKILIIISFSFLFFVTAVLIVKKSERISKTPDYIYYENLGTYLIGILVSLIPLLIILAVALLILSLVIRLLAIGAKSND